MTLHDAIRSGDRAKVARLVQSGADVDQGGPDGLTPLMIATGHAQAPIVRMLLAAGASVVAVEREMGASALHKAAQSGDPVIIDLLLEYGAFIDQQSPVLGHTALMDAVLYKHEAAVRLLLDRGARTMIRNHWQQTALDLARLDALDDLARLIEARDDANAASVDRLELVATIRIGDADALDQSIAGHSSLLERVPVTGTPDDDYTPLGLAVRAGRVDLVRRLLDAGADPGGVIGLMRGTLVHEASYHGHGDVVRLLTQHRSADGAPSIDLDAQGPYNGFTALHDAVWHGHHDAAQALIDAGARLDIRTHAGTTPRDLAILYGYDDLARTLAEAERDR